MSAITFDTLKFAERLEKAGVPREQAVAIVEAQKDAFAEALDSTLATKRDIDRLESRFSLLQWMIGFNLAFTMVMLWKIFS
jgi:hypothetical protein